MVISGRGDRPPCCVIDGLMLTTVQYISEYGYRYTRTSRYCSQHIIINMPGYIMRLFGAFMHYG